MEFEMLDYVIYALRNSNKTPGFCKTMLHKVLYFSLNKEDRVESFRPYFYGPYSDDVQFQINSLNKVKLLKYDGDKPSFDDKSDEYKIIDTYFSKHEKEFAKNPVCKKITTILNFIKDENLNAARLSEIAKFHIIMERKLKIDDPKDNNVTLAKIKEASVFYNWNAFDKMTENKFEKIKDYCDTILHNFN